MHATKIRQKHEKCCKFLYNQDIRIAYDNLYYDALRNKGLAVCRLLRYLWAAMAKSV